MDEIKALLQKFKDDLKANWDESKVDLANKLEAFEKRINELETAYKERGVIAGLEGKEKKEFSFFKSIYAIKSGDWSQAGFEKEVFEAARAKAMSLGSAALGGYIVPTVYIAELIELLRASSAVMQMGARPMPDLFGSPIIMPRQSSSAVAYWVAENSDITASDLGFEQLSLTPKKVAALCKLSNTLLKNSNPSAEAIIRADIARVLALKIDLACLRGLGSSGEPTGINLTSGIGTVAIGANGGAVTWDHLLDMEYELAVDNALFGKLGFIFHPAIRRNLLKRKVVQYAGGTEGAYITSPTSESNFQAWLGYPYAMSTQIPINLTKAEGTSLTEIYFGNWEEILIADWGGMQLALSNETSDAFQKDQTWIRILQEVDIGIRHAASFCLINDASATS